MLDQLFWAMPPRIVGGWGCRRQLAPLLQSRRLKAALIVTDTFFSNHTPHVSELRSALDDCGIDSLVFDGGVPDPSVDLCLQAQRFVGDSGWQERIDHVIALGGGSNMDLAKVLTLTLKFGGEPGDYVGEGRIVGEPLPLVAMPTTAGTGSEITAGAILVDARSATKVAVMANDLRPRIAVIDPELTLSCPPKVTAEAGLDALTHAIESYLTLDATEFDREGSPDPAYTGRNDITRLFAAEGIRLCFRHLPTAYAKGDQREAREGMAAGSLYAALSYATAGLNAVHGLAYALAGLTHASHGSTNAVFLPYVMDALRNDRRAELAEIGRLAGEPSDASEAELARRAVVRARELVHAVGIPTTLSEFGVSEADLPALVDNGLAVTRLTKAFPLQPARPAYERIVENAYAGRLDIDAGTA
jgi:alcohol dehydrogenase class IV